MKESRSAPRRRTLKGAKLILSSSTLIDCTVRDISATGARLELPGPTTLPHEFRLRVLNEPVDKPAELAWQRGLAAGIHFGSPAK